MRDPDELVDALLKTITENGATGSGVRPGENGPGLGSPGDSAPYIAPQSAALHGLAGDVVRALETHTEADPAGLLVNLLARFGSMVGRTAEARVGFAHHPPALFVAQVGRTSRSRKDTASIEVEGLMNAVEEGWQSRHQLSGFASGEAFIEQAAAQPGEAICMVESELARVLAVASRDGSTVSSVLRDAWGFRPLQHRIRGKRYEAPAAPVTLIGHISADELRDGRNGLRLVEVMNGFGNRILWVYVDRRRLLPSPRPVPEHLLSPLVRRLREALMRARRAGVVERTASAEELWSELYRQVASDEGAGIVDSLVARAEAHVLRLSLIYALLDGSTTIDQAHLEAGWEVWRYARWSAQHIWVGSGTGDPDVDRIAAVLDGGEELTARELDRMFQGHRSTRELRAKAVSLGVAAEGSRESGGRPAQVLRAADKAEKAEKARWWRQTSYYSGASSASSALSAADALQSEERPLTESEALGRLEQELDAVIMASPSEVEAVAAERFGGRLSDLLSAYRAVRGKVPRGLDDWEQAPLLEIRKEK
jgi:hypothetical protein